jgi:hypothetical protein
MLNLKAKGPKGSEQEAQSPRPVVSTEMDGDRSKETEDLSAKKREQREQALFKNLVADRKTLQRPQVHPKIDKAVEPWDDVSDIDAKPPPRQAPAPAEVELPAVATPDWLGDFEIRNTPKERAHDLADGFLRAIDHKSIAGRDVAQKWMFTFLNWLADPAIVEFVDDAIKIAIASRGNRQPDAANLRYLNVAMGVLVQEKTDWEEDYSAKRVERILAMWNKITAASPNLLVPYTGTTNYNSLKLLLDSIPDLHAPITTVNPPSGRLNTVWPPPKN